MSHVLEVSSVNLNIAQNQMHQATKDSCFCTFPGEKKIGKDKRTDRCEETKNGAVEFMDDERLTPKDSVSKTKTSCNACSAFCLWLPANEDKHQDDGCCVEKFRFVRNKRKYHDEEKDRFNKFRLCNDPDFVEQCASLNIEMWTEEEVEGWDCVDEWRDDKCTHTNKYDAVRNKVKQNSNLQNLKTLTDAWRIDELALTHASESKKIDHCPCEKSEPEQPELPDMQPTAICPRLRPDDKDYIFFGVEKERCECDEKCKWHTARVLSPSGVEYTESCCVGKDDKEDCHLTFAVKKCVK